MHEDRYGLALTTTSREASDLYRRALDRELAHQAGGHPLLEQATALDDRFALAWALLGLQLRAEGRMAEGNELVQRAVDSAAHVTDREKSHLNVLRHFTAARYDDALGAALSHLDRWPADATIVKQSHFLFNIFSTLPDRRERHYRLASSLLDRVGDDWYYLGEAAFAAEEHTRYQEAKTLAEESLDARPVNGAAAHALAHAYLELGDIDNGESWLRSWLSTWGDPSQFACHLRWHHALLRLADLSDVTGDVDEILSFVGRSISVLTDGASLLWRMHLAGEPDLPWEAIEDLPSPLGFSLSNFHRAFVLAGLDDAAGLAEWRDELARLDGSGHPSAGVCAVAVDAIRSFQQQDFGAAADQLESIEGDIPALGGSRAQLEVLDDTLIEALSRSGRREEASRRLARRLEVRPTRRDEEWRRRIG